ncbi:MAG TPA: RpiB/LacA/LacB family sugar-phosphate isomerase [Candidatus Saccharimonadales bacterium]|nr:RpiB/LacA/LacB family sugar-phosphate isomerase [Candidatus Saccharimonadales bacterium]
MKILAISNVEGCAERIVEAFEDTDASIVAKEESDGTEELAEKVSQAIGRRVYEYAVVAVDDQVGATIALNKMGNIRAAVCDSAEDVRLARKNDANVMIVRASMKRFDYLAGAAGQAAKPERDAKQKKVFEMKKQEEKEEPKEQRKKQQQQEKEEEEEPEDEEDDDYQKGSGKGMLGRLKDHLGIIDEGKK